MKLFLLVISIISFTKVIAQSPGVVNVLWQSEWNNQPLQLSTPYLTTDDATIEFEQIKMYVSGFKLLNNEQIVWQEQNSFHLLDFSDLNSTNWKWPIPSNIDYNKIQFTFGIDSLTQVSGVQGGPLDPTTGMYWTWQTGYIHLKLEGKSDRCPARNNQFQIHLGGYAAPHNTAHQVTLPVINKQDIGIVIPWDGFISSTDLSHTHHIMSPGVTADERATFLCKIFMTK